MNPKMTAWSAYRAGRLGLLSGYELKRDADVLHLLRNDGAMVATFSVRGVAPAEVERTVQEDYHKHGKGYA